MLYQAELTELAPRLRDRSAICGYDPFVPYSDPADQARAGRAHYEANKDVYKARASAAKAANRVRLSAYMREQKNRPCADCGIAYPYYVMQFDHLGESPKLFELSNARDKSLAAVQFEIEKCDVVCANCHAERTHQRRVFAGEVVAEAGFEPAASGL